LRGNRGSNDVVVYHLGAGGDVTGSYRFFYASPPFAAPQSFTTGPAPVAIAVGDTNGDGEPDIGVADGRGASLLRTVEEGAPLL
jgi:hypothetical protein